MNDNLYLDIVKESNYFGRQSVNYMFNRVFNISRKWDIKKTWDDKISVVFTGETTIYPHPLIFEFRFRQNIEDFDLANVFIGDMTNNATDIMGEFIFRLRYLTDDNNYTNYEHLHEASDTPDWVGRTGLRRYNFDCSVMLLNRFYGGVTDVTAVPEKNGEQSDGSPIYYFSFKKDNEPKHAYIDYTNKNIYDDDNNFYMFSDALIDSLMRDKYADKREALEREEEKYINEVKKSNYFSTIPTGELFERVFNIYGDYTYHINAHNEKMVVFIGYSTFIDETVMFEFVFSNNDMNFSLQNVYKGIEKEKDTAFFYDIVEKLRHIVDKEDLEEFVTDPQALAIGGDDFYDDEFKDSFVKYLFGVTSDEFDNIDMELDKGIKDSIK